MSEREENVCVVFCDDIPSPPLLGHVEENTSHVLIVNEADEGPAYSWPWRTFCVACVAFCAVIAIYGFIPFVLYFISYFLK